MSETKIIYKALADAGIAEGPAGQIAEAVAAVCTETAKRAVAKIGTTKTDADSAELQKQIADARVETRDKFAETQKQITDARVESRDDFNTLQKQITDTRVESKDDFNTVQKQITDARVESKDDFNTVQKQVSATQTQIADLRTELKDDINKSANTLRNWGFGFVGLVIAAIKFL